MSEHSWNPPVKMTTTIPEGRIEMNPTLRCLICREEYTETGQQIRSPWQIVLVTGAGVICRRCCDAGKAARKSELMSAPLQAAPERGVDRLGTRIWALIADWRERCPTGPLTCFASELSRVMMTDAEAEYVGARDSETKKEWLVRTGVSDGCKATEHLWMEAAPQPSTGEDQ